MLVKKAITILLFAGSVQTLFAQSSQSLSSQAIDSLRNEFETTHNDTLHLILVNQLRYNYFFVHPNLDSALFYSEQVLTMAQKLKYRIDEAYSLDLIGDVMNYMHSQNTLETFFKGVSI